MKIYVSRFAIVMSSFGSITICDKDDNSVSEETVMHFKRRKCVFLVMVDEF